MNSEQMYNPETVNAILGVMQRELEAQEKRDDFVLNKTNTILTVSGVLLAAISFLIDDFGGVLPRFVLLILIIGSLCVFCAILLVLFFVLRVESFEHVDFNALIKELERDSTEVKSRLIVTYREILEKNSKIVNHRVERFMYSIYFMIVGAIPIIFCIIYLYIAKPHF